MLTESERRNHKTLMRRLIMVSCVLLLIIMVVPIYSTDISRMEITQSTGNEFTWRDAKKRCELLGDGWQLPSLYQLLALYYRESPVEFIDATDYWSRNRVSGFAWGLNTARGIASFDVLADTDHYLCIRQRSLR